MLFRFYCDESYDGSPPGNARTSDSGVPHEPRTYVVAGMIAPEPIWTRIETRWREVNREFGVTRFHASHLNCKTYEYESWTDERKIKYSGHLLKILADSGPKLGAFTCGIPADRYREIFSEEEQIKLGHPHLMCFKTCIARVADALQKNPRSPNDQIAVVIDRSRFEARAVQTFCALKDNKQFPYHDLLATCTPADSEELVPLQAADLIAYEVFKHFNTRRDNDEAKMRKPLSILRENIGYDGGRYFSEKNMKDLKAGVAAAVCGPNCLVILPPQNKDED